MRGYFAAEGAEAIVPSDTVNIPGGVTEAIFIGTGGTITVVHNSGDVVQYTVASGTVLPVRAKRVNATGTAALLMVAMR